MFDSSTLLAFVIAGAAIIVVPGPAQAMVLARTLSQGRRAGVLTAVGLNVGTLVHAMAAGVGVASVLATSALAFAAVKYLGAAYLIYLGVQAWREGGRVADAPPVSGQQALARAVITGILNPKVGLFFVAFLPQFINPNRGSLLVQCMVLGMILAAMDVVYETLLVGLSATAASGLRSSGVRRWQSRFTGGVLVGLGVRLAFVERR